MSENIKKVNEKLVEKSVAKLEKIYGTEKGKNFVLHLVRAFLPVNNWMKRLRFDKDEEAVCCVTNQKLAGISDIAAAHGETFLPHCKVIAATTQKDKDAAVDELNAIISRIPEEVKNHNFAYCSETSNKFLSVEGIIALQKFVENKILCGDKEICFIINKKRFSGHKKLKPAEVNRAAKAVTYGTTFGDLPALKAIAKKMKSGN